MQPQVQTPLLEAILRRTLRWAEVVGMAGRVFSAELLILIDNLAQLNDWLTVLAQRKGMKLIEHRLGWDDHAILGYHKLISQTHKLC